MQNIVTVFRDIRETDTPFHRDVNVVLRRIKDGASKDLVTRIRQSKDKDEVSKLKRQLPSICFSGTFSRRNDASIKEHSGLICLDFDDYDSRKDLIADKKILIQDRHVMAVFISPSGMGLKALIRIPRDPDNHRLYFNALAEYFNNSHFDRTSKNISRVCYESYDENIHINYDSALWEATADGGHSEVEASQGNATFAIRDENKVIDILMRWWEKKFPMVDGQRNNNAYVLAAAFNEFGIAKSQCESALLGYSTSDFSPSEIYRTINSAYSHTDKFNTKFYEDTEKIEMVRERLRRGVPHHEIRSQLQDENTDPDLIDSVIEKVEDEQSGNVFWSVSDKGVVKVDHVGMKAFLEENGFFKFYPEGSNTFIFVRAIDNLVHHVTEDQIKDFALRYLMENADRLVYNFFAEKTKAFKEDFLSFLESIDINFIDDTKSDAYLYYRNVAVKVTAGGIHLMDYIDLGGYVWRDQVIDRNFTICDDNACDYKTFISNISGKDPGRISSMESTIGSLLHSYKDPGFSPATILNDEVISDNPEGGTGKGLFVKAISHMKKVAVIDGKAFDFGKSFAYQTVSADTQVICFDDVRKHFDFERLFSVITEGITLEKKNKDAIKIPFSKSPKVVITTNYAIKGVGNSFERRKWELELHPHYHTNFTPEKDFGRLMFTDWSAEEWCQFDNYMISNLRLYLSKGLLKSDFVNLPIRRLSAATCHEFIEWCGLTEGSEGGAIYHDERMNPDTLYTDFTDEYPDFGPKSRFTISRKKFNKWLTSYSIYKYGRPPEVGTQLGIRYIKFRK
jgi:hypothetical protein